MISKDCVPLKPLQATLSPTNMMSASTTAPVASSSRMLPSSRKPSMNGTTSVGTFIAEWRGLTSCAAAERANDKNTNAKAYRAPRTTE